MKVGRTLPSINRNGLFLKTNDGGKTWVKNTLQPETNLTAFSFISAEIGFINNAGGIHITYDGSVNRQAQKTFPLNIISQIEAVNEKVAYAFSQGGVYKLTDIGKPNDPNNPTNPNGIDYKSEIKIFPNPVKGRLYLSGKISQAIKTSILNINGQIVKTETQSSSEVDLSMLPAGIYTLILNDENDIRNLKFVKQ